MWGKGSAVELICGVCGPRQVDPCSTDVHLNREDGFQLVTATCPGCGDLLATTDGEHVAVALAAGARRWELKSPRPALTTDDLLDLHRLLDDEGWCERLVGGPG